MPKFSQESFELICITLEYAQEKADEKTKKELEMALQEVEAIGTY